MTLKRRFAYTFTIISFFLLLFTGCRKEEIGFIHNYRVEVVLSPGGVGDQGYNDKILRGFQKAAVEYGFTLAVHVPDKKEHGIQIYEDWLSAPLDDDCKRSLFVFSGSEYEYLLDEGLTLSDDTRRDVLLLESEKEYDGIYTFNVGCYAASYLAGATCVLDNNGEEQKALIIAANPHDRQVKRAVEGYRDGYLAAGGTGCDIHYLSEETDGGYRMQDEAYQFCLENDGNYMYYFSAAGASNKGMYRFSRESYNLAVGMDDDMGFFSSLITMSVVKHMDKVVIDVLGDLLENRDIPYHQKFTYSSGYEEMVFSEGMSADFFLDISDIRNRIVEIEQSYEESLQ